MSVAVEILNITKAFPKVVANDNVSISVDEGQILGLIGENGAGKSTLMKMLYGIYQPDSGEIKINGKTVRISSPHDAIAHGIGMVHQHFMLMPNLTVLQNIMLGLEPRQGIFIDEKTAREKIEAIMETYDLRVDLNQRIYVLSVGEKQRVEIIKALYRDAKILIMDEPTAVLTPQETDKLMAVLKRLSREGTTIIFITHKLREVRALTDKVTVMRKGVVTGTAMTADTNPDMLSQLMVGREVDLEIPRADIEPGEPVLSVHDLKILNKKGIPALRGVSFDVRRGEIVGIAGVEGNGQTELVECISGLSVPDSGTIRLNGNDITKESIRSRREAGMAHIPEDRLKVGTSKNCSIRDNLIMTRYYREPFAKRGIMDNRKLLDFSENLCKEFEVKTPNSEIPLAMLSGGNMQKVVLARELESDPELLLAAQPTRGVDIGAIEVIWHRLMKVRDAGKAILLVSAELDEVLALSDRVLVMYEGEIMAELSREEADENTVAIYMTGARRQEDKNGEN